MLFTVIPALAAVWALGGSLSALLERRWRGVWLVWAALAVQMVLFTSLGKGIPEGTVRVLHTATYLPIIGFLVANRGAGLGIVAAGVAANFAAIAANGGLMPADATAQRVFFDDNQAREHSLNTINESPRLLFLGDTMALPGWFPYSNAFSIGDMLLAIGIVWAVARLTLRSTDVSPLATLAHEIRQRAVVVRGVPQVAATAALAAIVGGSLADGEAAQAAALLILWLLARMASAGAADRATVRRLAAGTLVLTGIAIPVAGVPALFVAVCAAGVVGTPRTEVCAASSATLAATALGLGIGAPAVMTVGIAPVTAVAGLLAAASTRGGGGSAAAPTLDLRPAGRPARSTVVLALCAMAVGLVAAGALTIAAPLHGRDALGLGPEGFGILAGGVLCGALCGRLMAGALEAGRNASTIGLALTYCGMSMGLLASATLAMTAIAATVVLGVSAGTLAWLIQPYVTAAHRRLGAAAFVAGIPIGALAGGSGSTAALWAAALHAGLLGLLLLLADVPTRATALRARHA